MAEKYKEKRWRGLRFKIVPGRASNKGRNGVLVKVHNLLDVDGFDGNKKLDDGTGTMVAVKDFDPDAEVYFYVEEAKTLGICAPTEVEVDPKFAPETD